MYKFNDEQRKRIVELYKTGSTLNSIANEFGVTSSPISRVLKEEGVEIRKKRSSITKIKENQTKKCTVCGRELPLDSFYKGSGKFGRQSRCIECDKEIHASEHYKELRKESRNLRRKYSSSDNERDKQKLLEDENSYKKYMVRSAKQRALKKGLDFNITYEDFEIPERCPLLGIPLIKHVGDGNAKDDSPSLDRIKPELGYIKGNVWVISRKANEIKNNVNSDTLKTIAENLKAHGF